MADAPSLSLSDEELATRQLSLAAGLLAGQVVVVSGGGSGIGRATAWAAARLGAQVVLCGRKREKLEAVHAALTARGLACQWNVLDIRERPAVEALFQDVLNRLGRIDLLVNSAGGQFPKDALELSERGWQAVIDTNLNGTFHMVQSLARQWRAAGRPGSIVNLVVSPRGLHQVSHTCAARAGVVAFSEAVAVEWAPHGIRINCVAPGATASEGWAVYPKDIPPRYAQSCPMRRAASPWEVAEAVLFLGGPAAAFITGQTLHVNGGSNLWGETWTQGKPAWFVDASRAWQDAEVPGGHP